MKPKETVTAGKLTQRLLAVTVLFTTAVLAWQAWSDCVLYDLTVTGQQRNLRIEQLDGVIAHLDEVLTMSARMAATTGDRRWEARYRCYEPQLDAAIREAMTLVPEVAGSAAVAQIDAANVRLVELENRAFVLVRQGQLEKARIVLFSREYEAQKQIYAAGMGALSDLLNEATELTRRAHRREVLSSVAADLVVIVLLLVVWPVVLRSLGHWRAVLAVDAERRRTEEYRETLHARRQGINLLQQSLLEPAPLADKLAQITDAIVRLFDADFCRIWLIRPGDLCRSDCAHAAVQEGPHVCRQRDRCLHLLASSGRYTHTDGHRHRRVPWSCYKIGQVAAGDDHKFLTNNVQHDPGISDPAWARRLGLVSSAVYQLRVPGGEALGVLVVFAGHPLTSDEDAMLDGLSSTAALVAQQAAAENAVQQAKETAEQEAAKLSAMISGMEEGVVFADADNVIVEINDYLCRFVGRPREEPLGRRLEELHRGEPLTRIMAQIDQFRRQPGSRPWVFQRPLGGAEVILRMQPIYRNGCYDGVLLNVIDVSGLVEARRQAEAATQAKGRFLATISHEIRTPLTAILGYTDLLLDPALGPSERNSHLAVVRRNGEHLLHLINDVLDLAKIEAGKLTIDERRCSIVSILSDVASMMRPHAERRDNFLSIEYLGAMPATIVSDEARLRQTLINLVGNAVKFTEGGQVRLAASFLSDWREGRPAVRVAVIDSGAGIRPEVLPQLFQPFAQGDVPATCRIGGTGLGLAISRRIVDLLGGELTVASEFGRGSTFTLTVPTNDAPDAVMLACPAEAVQEAATATPLPTAPDLAGLRILLAEDGIDNQRLVGIILRKAGAEVEIAENGRRAVDMALAGDFHVVLMDINMPVMDGYEATRTLRDGGYRPPILALTAHALSGDSDRCLAAGCDGHLAKPIDRARLIETIAAHTRWAQACGLAGPPTTVGAPEPREQPETAIRSEFADDPEIAAVLDEFVAGLGRQAKVMRRLFASRRYDRLRRLAHQLKGAGGSYGYPSLTLAAAAVEDAVRLRSRGTLAAAVRKLAALCRAIRAAHAPRDSLSRSAGEAADGPPLAGASAQPEVTL